MHETLHKEGYANALIMPYCKDLYLVAYDGYKTHEEAVSAVENTQGSRQRRNSDILNQNKRKHHETHFVPVTRHAVGAGRLPA